MCVLLQDSAQSLPKGESIRAQGQKGFRGTTASERPAVRKASAPMYPQSYGVPKDRMSGSGEFPSSPSIKVMLGGDAFGLCHIVVTKYLNALI